MSFAPPRKSISKKKRAEIFLAHGGLCWLCKEKITEAQYDIDHQVAREIMGEGADDDSNLAPAHKDCHREKTKSDVKAIAKSNRIRRDLNPETRKRSKRPFPKPENFKWPSRPFAKKEKKE